MECLLVWNKDNQVALKQMEKAKLCHLHKQYSAASTSWSRELKARYRKRRFISIVLVSI